MLHSSSPNQWSAHDGNGNALFGEIICVALTRGDRQQADLMGIDVVVDVLRSMPQNFQTQTPQAMINRDLIEFK
jgi:hypothetical protein